MKNCLEKKEKEREKKIEENKNKINKLAKSVRKM
jgi:hypothetical protein